MKRFHLGLLLLATPLAAALQCNVIARRTPSHSRVGTIKGGLLGKLRGKKDVEQQAQIEIGATLPEVDVRFLVPTARTNLHLHATS